MLQRQHSAHEQLLSGMQTLAGVCYLAWRALRSLTPKWGYFYSVTIWLCEFCGMTFAELFLLGLWSQVERPARYGSLASEGTGICLCTCTLCCRQVVVGAKAQSILAMLVHFFPMSPVKACQSAFCGVVMSTPHQSCTRAAIPVNGQMIVMAISRFAG